MQRCNWPTCALCELKAAGRSGSRCKMKRKEGILFPDGNLGDFWSKVFIFFFPIHFQIVYIFSSLEIEFYYFSVAFLYI